MTKRLDTPQGSAGRQAQRPFRIGVINPAWAASHPTVTSLATSIANDITTTANDAPWEEHHHALYRKESAVQVRTIAATYAARSMLAFGALPATVMTLP